MAGGMNDIPLPDPLIYMAFLASATSRIKLGTGILILPQRNPVIAAKQVATLDRLSGGRILLGIGVGWLEEEFKALGIPFADRGRRTDEYVAAMRELWSSPMPSFDGEFVHFNQAHCQPQPINGSVPVIIGGHSKAAARRAGRIGNGYFPARNASAPLFDLVRQTAVEHGRDPADIEFTASMPESLDEIPALAQAGVSRLLIPVTPMLGLSNTIKDVADIANWRNIIEDYADL